MVVEVGADEQPLFVHLAGDALLVHGHLPPAWVSATVNVRNPWQRLPRARTR